MTLQFRRCILFLIGITVCPLLLMAGSITPEQILSDKIPQGNLRYDTFLFALTNLKRYTSPIIVETGTSRQGRAGCLTDGGATILFAEWAYYNGGKVYSVDISKENLDKAAEALGATRPAVSFIHADSVGFLQKFKKKIDFLYLDSYDFEFDNPNPSQLHHLKEIKAAYHCLRKSSLIMIDDCALPFGGKGKLVIDYLQHRGWKIVKAGYQVILAYDR